GAVSFRSAVFGFAAALPPPAGPRRAGPGSPLDGFVGAEGGRLCGGGGLRGGGRGFETPAATTGSPHPCRGGSLDPPIHRSNCQVWLSWPLQVHCWTVAPSARLLSRTSRQRPVPTFTIRNQSPSIFSIRQRCPSAPRHRSS